MTTIDGLSIEINSSAETAKRGLDALIESLGRLEAVASRQRGISAVASAVGRLGKSVAEIKEDSVSGLERFAATLSRLERLKGVKLSSSFATQIGKIGEAARGLDGVDFSRIDALSNGLASLHSVEKNTNLNSIVNVLKKFPDALQGISEIDSSKIEEFTNRCNELRTATEPLAGNMRNIADGFSAMTPAIQKAVQANTKLVQSTERVDQSMSTAVKSVVRFGAVVFGLRRAFNFAMDAFEASNDYVESLNLAEVAMGNGAKAAVEYAQRVEDLVGIDVSSWVTQIGTFNQQLQGFGIPEATANHMSQQLTQLGYDIQSVFNVKDIGSVMDKLSSGISGQIKGMREYGVELSVAAMQEYALAHGITQSWNSMSQAQKATLRYSKIMESTTRIQHDLARTIVTPANSLRILSSQFGIAQRYMGQIVSVIAARVIPAFQTIVQVVGAAAQAIASFFGFTLPDISSISSGLGGAAGGAEDLETALGGAGGAAHDAAQEVKGLLASWDEINVIQQEAGASTSGGGGGSGGASGDIGDFWNLGNYSYDFLDGIQSKVNAILAGFSTWWEKWSPAVYGLMAGVGAFLATNLLANWAISAWDTVKAAGGLLGYLRKMNKGTAIALGVAGLAAGFVTMEQSMEKILTTEDGWSRYWDVFTLGIVEAVGAGALSGFVLGGPVGALIGGLAGIATGVAAVIKAYDNVRQARLHDEFSALFGDVSLTTEQVKTLSDALTYSPFYAQAEIALQGYQKVETEILQAQTDLQSLSTTHWLISLGVMTGEEAEQAFTSELNQAVADLQQIVNDNGSSIKLMTDLVYGEGSEESERVGRITGSMDALLADLGKQAQDTFNAAWADGLYTIDEQAAVNSILQQISNIQARLNKAYGTGEIESALMGIDFANLDWESRDALYDSVMENIAGRREIDEELRAAHAGGLSMLAEEALMALEADPSNPILQTDYDAALKDYQDFIAGTSETSKALNDNLAYWDDYANGMAKDIFLTEDVIEHFAGAFNSVDEAFDIGKWNLGGDWREIADGMVTALASGVSGDLVQIGFDQLFSSLTGEYMRGMAQVKNSINEEDTQALWDDVMPWMAGMQGALSEARASGEAIVNACRDEMITAARAGAAAGDTEMQRYLFGSMFFDTGVSAQLLDSVQLNAELVGGSWAQGYLDSLTIAQDEVGKWYVDFGGGQTEYFDQMTNNMLWNLENALGLDVSQYLPSISETLTENEVVLPAINADEKYGPSLDETTADTLTWKDNLELETLVTAHAPDMSSIIDEENSVYDITKAWHSNMDSLFNFGGSSTAGRWYQKSGSSGGSPGGIAPSSLPIFRTDVPTIATFAGGGFPSTGELFIAKESGPEIVGQIGNQTAVANNGQIIDGIAHGVAESNREVERKLDALLGAVRQIASKEITATVKADASFGKSCYRAISQYTDVRG